MSIYDQIFSIWVWLSARGVRILLIALAAWFCYRALQAGLARLERRLTRQTETIRPEQRTQVFTLLRVWRSIGVFVILLSAGLAVLSQFGIEIAPLVAGAGLAGLALGLSAQTLMQDLIGGLLIILEDQFRMGDMVAIGNVEGKIERITLRVTYLRGEDGALHLVPNGTIRVLSNRSRKAGETKD